MWQEQIEIEYLDIRKENKNRFYKTLNSGKKMAKKKKRQRGRNKETEGKGNTGKQFFFFRTRQKSTKERSLKKGFPIASL